MNPNDRISQLAEKLYNNSITSAEEEEFNVWYESFSDHEITAYNPKVLKDLEISLYEKIQLRNANSNKDNGKKRQFGWLGYVASLFLICSLAFLYKKQFLNNPENRVVPSMGTDQNRATLSFDNGKSYDLTSLNEGDVAHLNGVQIVKSTNGELVYISKKQNEVKDDLIITSTLTVPKGSQYKVLLPDETQVWLNANSSITFPSTFRRDRREVELTGEAYFEVTRNDKSPFIVKTKQQDIKVLGTSFNVNAYESEQASRTTLVSGKVQIHYGDLQQDILPGEQAILNKNVLQIDEVDVSRYTSWINGVFHFDEDNIESVMRKIARWYGLEYEIVGEMPKDLFTGVVSNKQNLGDVLRTLEITGKVKFKIEGNEKIIVKK